MKLNNHTIGFLMLALAVLLPIMSFSHVLPFQALNSVWAETGHYKDIQEAVDYVVATWGEGNVFIPEGEWIFAYEQDNAFGSDYGTAVEVPNGVNIFGSPTERGTITYNGEVMHDMPLQWKTVLKLGYDVPSNILIYGGIPLMFHFNSGPHPARFSDIMLEGWRATHEGLTNQIRGVAFDGVIDARCDHVYMLDIVAGNWMGGSKNQDFRGVIDHCIFKNSYGVPFGPGCNYNERTLGYGWGISAMETDVWEPDISNVQGHYGWMTVFIENCYFSLWRHSYTGGHGAHVVFRYNVVKGDFGFGSVDSHGTYVNVATRAVEIYHNRFLDPIWENNPVAFIRGGGAIFWNNTVRNDGPGYYYALAQLDCEGYSPIVGDLDDPQDIYVWENNLAPPTSSHPITVSVGTRIEGVHYFFTAMPDWTAYPYPHYLVTGGTPPETPPDEPAPPDTNGTQPPTNGSQTDGTGTNGTGTNGTGNLPGGLPDLTDVKVPPEYESAIVPATSIILGAIGLYLLKRKKKWVLT